MIKLFDLEAEQWHMRDELEHRIKTVLDLNEYVGGPHTKVLEGKLSRFVGSKHAIGCSSGTDALLIALMALGTDRYDEVITTPFTFASTAEAIVRCGGKPLFVDIDPNTFNIDPDKVIEVMKTRKNYTPIGMIPVNMYGMPADYKRLNAIAEKHDMFVVEDAAQSLGGSIGHKMSGSFGVISCTSFYPTKPLGAYGDGGMCFTNDDRLDRKLRSLIVHGQQAESPVIHERIGITGRLDAIQAAVLSVKFTLFKLHMQYRQRVASFYDKEFQNVDGIIRLPAPKRYQSANALYTLLAQDSTHRRRIQEHLETKEVGTGIYYPIPLHEQPAFSRYAKGRKFPVAEEMSERVFSIPAGPDTTQAQQEYIIESIKEVL